MEFKSKLEEIMTAVELDLEPTPSFGKYKPLMPSDSISHPAKINTNLVEFLIKNFTKEGDCVLDPMAGTGVMGVIASLHNRNAVQVEIEPRFFKWMEEARENVEKLETLSPKGKIVNLLGDARELSKLMNNIDAIITSPPYSDTYLGGGDPERRKERLIKSGYDPRDFLGGKARNAVLKHYGEVDATITSPPYDGSLEGTTRHTCGGIPSRDKSLARTGTYADLSTTIQRLREHGRTDPSQGGPFGRSLAHPYTDVIDENNIGNLKSSLKEYEDLERGEVRKDKKTYISEMMKVYGEMYKVLKPGGIAMVVVKPFIRDKKVVDLPYYTYLMMKMCGFNMEKLYKLRLKAKSFWRILYKKKFPEVPEINHEYILIARKP